MRWVQVCSQPDGARRQGLVWIASIQPERSLEEKHMVKRASSLRERRLANQTVFRRANERLSRRPDGSGSLGRYVCECGDDECDVPVALLPSAYEHVRSHPTWFLIAPGHEIPADALERVVETHDEHEVVEKSGAAGRVAEETAYAPTELPSELSEGSWRAEDE